MMDQTDFSLPDKQTLYCRCNGKDRWFTRVIQAAASPTLPLNSAEDYCSAVAAAVAVVANQAVAAAGAVSSIAVHSGLAVGRTEGPQLRALHSPAAAVEIPEE